MYTQNDLKNVQKAILELAQGQRVVQVQVAEQVIRYASTDLNALQQLERRIQQQLTRRPKLWQVVIR